MTIFQPFDAQFTVDDHLIANIVQSFISNTANIYMHYPQVISTGNCRFAFANYFSQQQSAKSDLLLINTHDAYFEWNKPVNEVIQLFNHKFRFISNDYCPIGLMVAISSPDLPFDSITHSVGYNSGIHSLIQFTNYQTTSPTFPALTTNKIAAIELEPAKSTNRIICSCGAALDNNTDGNYEIIENGCYKIKGYRCQ